MHRILSSSERLPIYWTSRALIFEWISCPVGVDPVGAEMAVVAVESESAGMLPK